MEKIQPNLQVGKVDTRVNCRKSNVLKIGVWSNWLFETENSFKDRAVSIFSILMLYCDRLVLSV